MSTRYAPARDSVDLDAVNLSELEFWSRPWSEREAVFRVMRRERPIMFFEEPEVPSIVRGNGYFAITRHADILEMSRRPDARSAPARVRRRSSTCRRS